MNFAIIKTGGKQYKVKEGDILNIEKIDVKKGDEVVFDKILMKSNNNDIELGTPIIKDSKVKAMVIDHKKADKVVIFKYKPKSHYKKKTGHRQPYTQIKIKEIN